MNIRNFLTSESHQITDLYYDAVHANNTAIYTKKQFESWAPIPPDYDFCEAKLKESKPFAATISGKIAGFLELKEDGHIDSLYFRKNYQRQGIAAASFVHASKVALKGGCQMIYVEASIKAKCFLEKNGFEVVAQNIVKRNRQDLDNYSMYGQPKL